MMKLQKIEDLLTRFRLASVIAYLVLVALFVSITILTVLDIQQSRVAAVSAAEILQTLQSHTTARTSAAAQSDVSVPAGSPFLEGATVSVAAAALLQRVLLASKRVNGNTLSSQVDLLGPRSKAGFVSATFILEIAPTALQPLLYDLEAGMPFMFVDELVIQASSAAADKGKLRLVLGVSAQRQSPK